MRGNTRFDLEKKTKEYGLVPLDHIFTDMWMETLNYGYTGICAYPCFYYVPSLLDILGSGVPGADKWHILTRWAPYLHTEYLRDMIASPSTIAQEEWTARIHAVEFIITGVTDSDGRNLIPGGMTHSVNRWFSHRVQESLKGLVEFPMTRRDIPLLVLPCGSGGVVGFKYHTRRRE